MSNKTFKVEARNKYLEWKKKKQNQQKETKPPTGTFKLYRTEHIICIKFTAL